MNKKLLFNEYEAIKERRAAYRETALVHPEPPKVNTRQNLITRHNPKATFIPLRKIKTTHQLQKELARQRRQFAPFLKDLAPPLPDYHEQLDLTRFNWRIETEKDRQDFRSVLDGKGEWEKVKVPHYGEPIGKAATLYRTAFTLSRRQLKDRAAILRFKGVDYKAHVFVNDIHVGSHEGFFAPFEFDCTAHVKAGRNILVVRVENDITCGSFLENLPGRKETGNKIYAATGLGYDDPLCGWHHCPPGMGIYQDVTLDLCPTVYISDIYVRPLPGRQRAEAWIEVTNTQSLNKRAILDLSLFGQNFRKTIFKHARHDPQTVSEVGYGDSLQVAKLLAIGMLDATLPLDMEAGKNTFRLSFAMTDFRWWTLEKPWLYQLQVRLTNPAGKAFDAARQHFGMRSFAMEGDSTPKGRFLFNGAPIRLRGANTMGHLQQCVFKKDPDQLMDDILLARVCNMNFLRITQRPVQPEIYDMCDRLGMLAQTDLPLFGQVRREHVCELLRQSEEMERLVRPHPSNILVSYMNEHFPNGNNHPHRNLTRAETETFFALASDVIRLCNPERVIKPTDGDYDPPAPAYPDRHCYSGWYNGQGVDIGMLNRGWWQPVKSGWHYGCGEFGAEAIDPVNVMTRYYPAEWLPVDAADEKDWTPTRVIDAQTGMFHYLFYDTPESLEGWVQSSHAYQAWATRTMTEAFRRDRRMNSFAIHLFIDAFPAGWMKAIMDVARQPKQAYFAYRNALAPLLPSIRTDRFAYFPGETMALEAWICNDLNDTPRNTWLHYQFEIKGKVFHAGRTRADIAPSDSTYQGMLKIAAPGVSRRTRVTVRLALVRAGKVLNDSAVDVAILPPPPAPTQERRIVIRGKRRGKAATLARDLGLAHTFSKKLPSNAVILMDDINHYDSDRAAIDEAVKAGALAIILDLPDGSHRIGKSRVQAKASSMGALHFVSRKTGHALVEGFQGEDFRLWHDPQQDCFAPLMDKTFTARGWTPILTSGNLNHEGQWDRALAAAEKPYGQGRFVICQVALAGRIATNPVARLFAQRLVGTV